MKQGMFRQLCCILLITSLCVSLLGCGKGTYEEGYEAGFAAARKPLLRKPRLRKLWLRKPKPWKWKNMRKKALC